MPSTYISYNCYNFKQFELTKLLSFSETQPDLEKIRNRFSQNFEIKKIRHIRFIIKISSIICQQTVSAWHNTQADHMESRSHAKRILLQLIEVFIRSSRLSVLHLWQKVFYRFWSRYWQGLQKGLKLLPDIAQQQNN